MEHWQFLIQKQGDRSWLPLASPNVEIFAGQYRIVARSSHFSTLVQVRVTHEDTLESPPKRRVQRRSLSTNSQGLVAVLPFTYLKPGIWEVQCSEESISDTLPQSWQYSVQLQVLPKQADGDLSPHQSVPVSADFTSSPEEDAVIDEPVSPVWIKAETAEQILHNLIELALPTSLEVEVANQTVEHSPAVVPVLPLRLNLDEEIYIAHWGQSLAINGRVELHEMQENLHLLDDTSDFHRVYAGELQIDLRSPHESKILMQVRQPLPENLLPFPIKCLIEIPSDCESKLILADINLYGTLTPTTEVILLASQSFTITADVTQLLTINATAKPSNPDELDFPSTIPKQEQPKPSVSLDLALLNLVKTAKPNQSQLFPLSDTKSLPAAPSLPTVTLSVTSPSLQLPNLPVRQNQTITPATNALVISEFSATDADDTTNNLDDDYTVTADYPVAIVSTSFPYLRRLNTLPDEIPRNFQHLSETVAEDEEVAKLPELVTDVAQSSDDSFDVNLQLSSEVETTNNLPLSPLLMKWVQNQGYPLPEQQYQDYDNYVVSSNETISDEQIPFHVCAEITNSDANSQSNVEVDTEINEQNNSKLTTFSSSLTLYYPETTPAWVAQEIVVDDLLSEPEVSECKEQPLPDVSVSRMIAGVNVKLLPIPQLHVPERELLAGQSVRVSVELPAVDPELAVKLWVKDCQTRSLLDGPHWLKDLLPNTLGGLEVTTQLNIPFGCLEICIEAIAVDLSTQQESDKVSIQRTVIPPDLPNLQLDELFGI